MARTLLVTDALKVTVWTQQGAQACENIFSYVISPTFTAGVTDVNVATAIDTAAQSFYKALMNNNASYRGVTVSYWNVTPLPLTEESNAFTGAGTAGATALPTQCRGILRRLTNYSGRAYRGRIYFPFPSTAHDSGTGTPLAAYETLMQSCVTAISPPAGLTVTGGGGSATLFPVIWHRKNGNFSYIILHETVLTGWGTQRKSGGFGRPNTPPF